MIKRIDITQNMIANAMLRDGGAFNNFSFMGGGGNLVGFLGEEMVKYAFPYFDVVNGFDYDFEYDGKRIEVKTKSQSIPTEPLGYYEASIADQSMFQNTDVYIFCRIFKYNNVYHHGWIMGWITSSEFILKSRRLLRGQPDGDNGYIVKENCYNIPYNKLNGYE